MAALIEIIFILLIILIIFTNIVQYSVYKKYKKEENKTKLSGFEIARNISSKLTHEEPHIIKKKGLFLDSYSLERNVIKLSPEVFDGTSIYAALVAIGIALETNPNNEKALKNEKIAIFLILSSYLMIILGAFLNNPNIIYFGFVLFISAYVIEIVFYNTFGRNITEINKTYDFIKDSKVIAPFDEYERLLVLIDIIKLATLPYIFIKFFR